MRRVIASIGLLLYALSASPAFAQTGTTLPALPQLTPAISGPSDIAVGRILVLDASGTRGLGENTTYRWYRDDMSQPISRSVEAVFTPEESGVTVFRLVVQTTISDEVIEAEVTHVVIVYDRKIVLIADPSVPSDKLALHQQAAAEAGVFLRILQPQETPLPLDTEEALINVIVENGASLTGAEAIVLWTEGITGIQALLRAAETEPQRVPSLETQSIMLITEGSLQRLSRTVQGHFAVLRPDRIIVTRKEAINPLVSAINLDQVLTDLELRDIDYDVVDESNVGVRPWNLLSSLVNFMLTHGVSSQTVILLLTLPVIATILAFLKQVIGVTTFGLYTPSIVALSFLALGWGIGLLFLLAILGSGYATRTLMRRWRLLHIPKVAIILTAVSITLLLLLGAAAAFDITFSRDTVFVLLIMSTLAESFLTLKNEEGMLSAVLGVSETILAALLCVFIVQWSPLQSLILAFPELILLTIVFNAFLGRWTGLRLVEYFRFREVFKHLQEE